MSNRNEIGRALGFEENAWRAENPAQVRTWVVSFAQRLEHAYRHPKPYTPLINLPRTTVAQEAHVMCLSVGNPRALDKYIREVNVFWTNVYRHGEEELLAGWKPREMQVISSLERNYPTDMEMDAAWVEFDRKHGLPNDFLDSDNDDAIVERTTWDRLSQVQIEPKGQS